MISFDVVKVLFGRVQHSLILMLSCAEVVPAAALIPRILILVVECVRVRRDDGDLRHSNDVARLGGTVNKATWYPLSSPRAEFDPI